MFTTSGQLCAYFLKHSANSLASGYFKRFSHEPREPPLVGPSVRNAFVKNHGK